MKSNSNISYKSKRNTCYLDVNKNCVVKKFSEEKYYFIEKDMYLALNQINSFKVPKLLKDSDESLVLEIEYIEGLLVLEQLEIFEAKGQVEEGKELLLEVINLLKDFYGLSIHKNGQVVFGDVNLRNFIITNQYIVAIDFEQSKEGNQLEELNYLIAMYMLYDPINSMYKQEVLDRICGEEPLTYELVKSFMSDISLRRKNALHQN